MAETEEFHRAAFNAAFAQDGLNWTCSVNLYRDLLGVTGGKERMRHYANLGGGSCADISEARIAHLQKLKNEYYAALMRDGAPALRSGVERLVRSSHAKGLQLAIATTTSRANAVALTEATLGASGLTPFEIIVAGDEASAKKPAPDACLCVLYGLGLAARECLAFEDSRNGLVAARAANLTTIVTPSRYAAHESFGEAALVLPNLLEFDRLATRPETPIEANLIAD